MDCLVMFARSAISVRRSPCPRTYLNTQPWVGRMSLNRDWSSSRRNSPNSVSEATSSKPGRGIGPGGLLESLVISSGSLIRSPSSQDTLQGSLTSLPDDQENSDGLDPSPGAGT